MNISIIIPAYNEEKRIDSTIKKILIYSKKRFNKYEIILVDDASIDKTTKIVSKYKKVKILKNKKNKGKGYSIKKGIFNAKYEFILFTDSDLATPIFELEKLIDKINKGYDIVISSRNLKTSKIITKQPIYRQFLGKIFPYLVKLIVISNIKDTQCGFKLFKKDVAVIIAKKQTLNRYCFDVEQLLIAKKMGFKIKEIGVKWIDKKGSKVNIIKDSLQMLIDLFIIKYKSLRGYYNK
jgi:dolichyl-phosphate beta-glucosyltransferase